MWIAGRVLFAGQLEKVLRPIWSERRPCWGGKSPWSIVVSLVAPRTSAVVVASTQVDSGRFSALDKDLSDTEVDEGGGEAPRLSANVRESTVNESSNFEVIAMSDAEGPTFGRRRLVVSQQEVPPTVMDVPSVVSGESHEPSEVESDVESIRCSTRTTLLTNVDMPIVDLMIGVAALQDLDDVDLEAEFCTRACVMKSALGFLANSGCCTLDSESPSAQHPCSRTRCVVVANGIQRTATTAKREGVGDEDVEGGAHGTGQGQCESRNSQEPQRGPCQHVVHLGSASEPAPAPST